MTHNGLPPGVREVAELALGGRVLGGGAQGLAGVVVTLRDFGRALEAACRQETEDESVISWEDIRGLEMSKVWEALYGRPDYKEVAACYGALCDEIDRSLEKTLPPRFREIADDVGADFRGSVFNRVAGSTPSPFYERLFQVYAAGCWPCGWEGAYPEGSLLVYDPGTAVGTETG
jgi:hypothetical protein